MEKAVICNVSEEEAKIAENVLAKQGVKVTLVKSCRTGTYTVMVRNFSDDEVSTMYSTVCSAIFF